jgi:hypothetical protein
MKPNKKVIIPLILLAGGGLALYFIMKGKKKPDIEPAPPAPADLPTPSITLTPEKVVEGAKKVINKIKQIKKKRDERKNK